MTRADLIKWPYDVMRTRIELPHSLEQWEVTTIDVIKFEGVEKISQPLPMQNSSHPFTTMVYRLDPSHEQCGTTQQGLGQLPLELHFHQSYDTTEEALFGHEELVQRILNYQFFHIEPLLNKDIASYLLYPEIGMNAGQEAFHFLPYAIAELEEFEDLDRDDLELEEDSEEKI